MKILVLICIIGFLIIFFPQGSFTAVIELLTAGGQIFFRIVPMLLGFIGPIINAFFSTRYLISLLAFFVFANLLVILIRFIKGQSTGFNEGIQEVEEEDIKIEKAVNKPKNRISSKQQFVAVHGQKLSHGINKKVKLIKGYDRIYYRKR